MSIALKITAHDLDERESAFCAAIINGQSVGDAALSAGYPHRPSGYQVLRRPRVQRALFDFRQRVINSEGAALALKTMIELLSPSTPAGTRFNAARTVLALAGHHVDNAEKPGEKPLHEQNETELRALVDRLQKAMEEHAEPAALQLTDATASHEAQA